MSEKIPNVSRNTITTPSGLASPRMAAWMEAITLCVNNLTEEVEVAGEGVSLIDGVQPTVDTVVSLFTSPSNGGGTRIDRFTATNQTTTSETYTVYIVPNGGSPDNTNRLLVSKPLNAAGTGCGDTDNPPEVMQTIPAGGTLQVMVSTATTISFRASGVNL
tara:strand:- start:4821 stop:5303 length:483 start_codon:yes stop_codon:yes gene_type:complete